MSPRDSVKGGQTEMFKMYCRVENSQSERIRYLDVNSLYPNVMSEIDFPFGHPEIRRGDYSCRNLLNRLTKQNEKFIGICQVRVLPPDKLFIPCLAYKMNGKLLFCLCQTCACGDNIQRKAVIMMIWKNLGSMYIYQLIWNVSKKWLQNFGI